ncbi:MAG: T9SS type A sorting domain-containing protein [Bacteroidales bacterium]|nr:T9SS type A sorting domain-containing protein [Bacteroidales bacterium]
MNTLKKLFTLLIAFVIVFSANAQPILDEGFETWPPTDWGFFQLGDPAGWIEGTSVVHTGSAAAYHNDDNVADACMDWMVTPALDIDNNGYFINFWEYQNYSAYYLLHKVSVLDGPDPSTATELEVLYSQPGTEDAWAEVNLSLAAYNGQIIYIGFYYEGDYNDEWSIDDVVVDCTPAPDHDIGVDVVKPTFVNSGDSYTPKVTLHNYGTNTESDFDVTITINDGTSDVYSSTSTVSTSFFSDEDMIVIMDDEWTTPGDDTYSVTAEVVLTGDENAANDILIDACVVAEGSIAYCWPQGGQSLVTQGPSYFYLQDPDGIYNLVEETSTSVYAGAMANHVWYAADYMDQTLISIDKETGVVTPIGDGDLGVYINGMAYDYSTDVMYGITGTSLYTVDLTTGVAVFVANCGIGGSTFGNLACNEAGELYSLNRDDASLYSINKTTGAAALIGALGIDIATQAQDMEFDVENDILYIASYEDDTPATSNLRTVDVSTGVASAPIGAFPKAQICGFAVPYSLPTDVLAYSFPEQTTPADIDYIAHTIDIEVFYGTDVTTLVADFTLVRTATAVVGAVTQVSGTTANDFTTPVTYTVTGDDASTEDWLVTVTIALNHETDFLTYSLPGQTDATINTVLETIHVDFPFGTDVSDLIATFTLSDGAGAMVGTYTQTSGVTANDFTGAVYYVVTAQNETNVGHWTISADIADNDSTDILSFDFEGFITTGNTVIDDVAHTVDVEVYDGTDLTALTAVFELSTGAIAFIGTTPQHSGNTVNTYTETVTYTIEAQDGTTQDWTVTVHPETSIEDLNANGISIYPNPSNGVFNVNVTETFNLEVIDITGKVVKTQVLDNNTNTVNIAKQGVYILKLSNNNTSVTHRIIVN